MTTDIDVDRPGDAAGVGVLADPAAPQLAVPVFPPAPSILHLMRELLPVVVLLLVTIAAWLIYLLIHWPQFWQHRLMHPLLFAAWTIAWHGTVRGQLANRLGWSLSLLPALLVPPLAACGGEAIQAVIHGAGHDPEWAGAGYSLLGVAIGWLVVGSCRWLQRA